jgi:hypothetical protein
MFLIFLKNYIKCKGSMQPYHVLNWVTRPQNVKLQFWNSVNVLLNLPWITEQQKFWVCTRHDFTPYITFSYMTHHVLPDLMNFQLISCPNM